MGSAVGGTGSSTSTTNDKGQTSYSDAFQKLDMNEFIKIMVTELQNQDPMEPMKNNEILEQMSQIRSIASNDRLTTTLESVLLGQAVATGSNLIDHEVVALNSDGDYITGKVESVAIAEGKVKLRIGDYEVDLNKVSQIVGQSADATE